MKQELDMTLEPASTEAEAAVVVGVRPNTKGRIGRVV